MSDDAKARLARLEAAAAVMADVDRDTRIIFHRGPDAYATGATVADFIWLLAERDLLDERDHLLMERALKAENPTPIPAWNDVLAERRRQVNAEGWTPEHDDKHADGEMARAAAAYAYAASLPDNMRPVVTPGSGRTQDSDGNWFRRTIETLWPWDFKWWKPKDRRRDLVRAGALILADIERIDRAAESDFDINATRMEHG